MPAPLEFDSRMALQSVCRFTGSNCLCALSINGNFAYIVIETPSFTVGWRGGLRQKRSNPAFFNHGVSRLDFESGCLPAV